MYAVVVVVAVTFALPCPTLSNCRNEAEPIWDGSLSDPLLLGHGGGGRVNTLLRSSYGTETNGPERQAHKPSRAHELNTVQFEKMVGMINQAENARHDRS
jgi:hypothetical protein